MSFRLRLILFIVATLAPIQLFTGALIYDSTRQASIDAGSRQLAAAAQAFVGQLDDVSVRVVDTVTCCRSITRCARRSRSAIARPWYRPSATTAVASAPPA